MKVEHPEFWEHPIKCGKREFYHFKNWQEALEELVIKSQQNCKFIQACWKSCKPITEGRKA